MKCKEFSSIAIRSQFPQQSYEECARHAFLDRPVKPEDLEIQGILDSILSSLAHPAEKLRGLLAMHFHGLSAFPTDLSPISGGPILAE
jgi:hypothetical protein